MFVCFASVRATYCGALGLQLSLGAGGLKRIRISREKRKQTDYTAALVQPKALLPSRELSATLINLSEDPQSGEKFSSRGFERKQRQFSFPFTGLRCQDEQGYVT